jgi:hypothetical protein
LLDSRDSRADDGDPKRNREQGKDKTWSHHMLPYLIVPSTFNWVGLGPYSIADGPKITPNPRGLFYHHHGAGMALAHRTDRASIFLIRFQAAGSNR